MGKKGLSLLEILVSSIILALLITGLANVFVATRRLTYHARARVSAAELAKRYLDPLQMQVSQADWSTKCLGVGTDANCDTRAINPEITEDTTAGVAPCQHPSVVTYRDCTSLQDFTRDYEIVDKDLGSGPIPHDSFIRRVSVKISWTERNQ